MKQPSFYFLNWKLRSSVESVTHALCQVRYWFKKIFDQKENMNSVPACYCFKKQSLKVKKWYLQSYYNLWFKPKQHFELRLTSEQLKMLWISEVGWQRFNINYGKNK